MLTWQHGFIKSEQWFGIEPGKGWAAQGGEGAGP